MNRRMIVFAIGNLLSMTGFLLFIPVMISFIYHESQGLYFGIVGAFLLLLGFLISRKTPKKNIIFSREGFVIVALSWILVSAFSAIPYVLSGEIPRYVDAFFEMVSGFTTTGSSILTNFEGMSHTGLFWRSFTHWIGGMGILVFVIAFIPIASGRSMHILKAEVPGPVVGKLVSKVRATARILYVIYAALTVIEIVLLLFGGMPLFDSILNAFGTAGTGGFAIKNASIAAYHSAYFDVVITIFMILFGINFNLFYFILIGKVKDALRSEELHYYLGIIALCIIVITCNVLPTYKNVLEALRYAGFTVASTITTTGFVVVDYGKWPLLSQMIILVLTFVGASSGSTGGGIKISRIVMYFKSARKELRKALHPHSVQTVEFENQPIDGNVISSIQGYLVIYLIIFVVSLLILSCYKIDFASAFSAVATCLNNVGPGMNVVGPVGNFSSLSDVSKLVLSFDMLAGRLEIFPMLLVFAPSSWRK